MHFGSENILVYLSDIKEAQKSGNGGNLSNIEEF